MRGVATALMLAGATLATSPAAYAQTADAGSELNEIVVTATKRSESIQTVGLSMTAFDSASLESKGVVSFVDYASAVPNLSFSASGDGALAARSVALRGIQGRGTTGMYIDDTPIIDSLDPRVLDIDRIEVLRGPQGTLYGARSMGGTIRLITKQPDFKEMSGEAHGNVSTTSHGGTNYLIDGGLNLPLSDKVAMRVSAFDQNDDGIFDRAFGPRTAPPTSVRKNVDRSETYGGQIALRWEPIEGLSVTPRVMYERTTLDGFPYADQRVDNFVQRQVFDLREGGHDKWTLSSLTINYQASYGTFTSSTSYFDRTTFEHEDSTDVLQLYLGFPDAIPGPITLMRGLTRFAQEARFASSFAGPLQIVSGVFYSDGKVPRDYEWTGVGLADAGVGAPSDLALAFIDERKTTELAFFGEASYQVLPKLKATLGLRYFKNETTFSQNTDGFFYGGPLAVSEPKTSEDGITPKYLLEYQATPDILLYTSASKGFRIGGNNITLPTGPGGCDEDLAAIGLTNEEIRVFKSDTLWDYDIGLKSTFANRRVTLNVAAFRIDWKNIQQSIALPNCGYGYTGNSGKARSKGFELALSARPVEQLTFGLNAGYTDAHITEEGPGSPQAVGSNVYQVPDWTGSLNIEYAAPMYGDYEGFARTDYSYTGSSLSANNDPINGRERDAYRLLDARLGVRKGAYEVALFGKNLTNEHANLADNISIGAEYPGRPRLVVNRPRTIGVEVRARF
jgi:outer membrane receptor protein involved in Fe transport